MKKLCALFLLLPGLSFASGIYNPGSSGGGSGGDSLGSHIATMTITAPYGIVGTSLTMTNPPNQAAVIQSDGYGDTLKLYQSQYIGNYGLYLVYNQALVDMWKIGSDLFDYNCSDGVSNCMHAAFVIKNRSLNPVFTFDQNHRMTAGRIWSPGINYFNFSGNLAQGSWLDIDTAPVNGAMISGNTIVGSTNAWALNTTAQMQIYGSPTNGYSLFVSTSLLTLDLAVSTTAVVTVGKTLSVGPYGTSAALTVANSAVFKSPVVSTAAFLISDTSGNSIFRVDNSVTVSTDTLWNVTASTAVTWGFGVSTNTVTGPWGIHVSSAGLIALNGTDAPANSQALCLLGGSLGHCTSVVGAGGGCTCVSP